ncbi:hypothetical protein F152LOC_03212 [Pectobacterium brasiliense]|nr:hypothetical protein F152LOC_03212 [Pectobacterium brasiliense]
MPSSTQAEASVPLKYFCNYSEGSVHSKPRDFLQLTSHAPDAGRLNCRRPATPGFSRGITPLRGAFRRSYPLIGPPATCSRHGADFRGVHAAHPAATLTSAQFFYANQSHKIQRLNFVHCYFGADVSVCAESGLSRPVSGTCCNGCRKNRG